MQPTRLRILEILKEQGDLTVAEMARQLGMAPVSVRHHLDVLQGEQLICSPSVRRRGTVGRPRQIYALTEAANAYFPRNHGILAGKLLEEMKGVLSPGELQALFERLADSMAAEARPLPADATMKQRVERAVEFLNEKGYLARYELVDGQYMLYTLNCPYQGIAEQHRELCGMDKRLLDRLIGAAPTVVTRMSEGACNCAYRVDGAAVPDGQRSFIPLYDLAAA
ncbi:MAG: ArsR family transcriptional regulator [Anaerolineae bacterium]|nr:ArsR family transcriptional regulator [Anaerolineae bacterium]MCB0004393.1 ArsR family transcriptional regulator [Anaerolineae bacterium]MCB0230646.1 ArsR family transcriptional regulator [Anaerolineae bacterium]MCB0237587.1 ArsR family transcriptional regulator [Anaerolineae bacterium]